MFIKGGGGRELFADIERDETMVERMVGELGGLSPRRVTETMVTHHRIEDLSGL